MKNENTSLDLQLIDACGNLEYDEVLRLLDAGANPNAIDEDGYDSALTKAIFYSWEWERSGREYFVPGFWKVAELLLERGADVNKILRGVSGEINTALFSAQYTIPEVTEFLLKNGANPNVISDQGETILDAIIFRQHIYGPDERNSAEWGSNNQIRKILLDHGAHSADTLKRLRESKRWDKIRREQTYACWRLDAEALEMVLTENRLCLSPELCCNLIYEILEVAREFMQRSFIDDEAGYEKRLIAMLAVLQNHGGDFNAGNGDALYYAVKNGYVESTRYLLAHGADPEIFECDCWIGRDSVPHYYTLANRILQWRNLWKKETAQDFFEIFHTILEKEVREVQI